MVLVVLEMLKISVIGVKVILVAETYPAPAPHAQRIKSPVWSQAFVMYSALFLCSVSKAAAAVFTAGMRLEWLLVPAAMMTSTSQGVAKKDADPG